MRLAVCGTPLPAWKSLDSFPACRSHIDLIEEVSRNILAAPRIRHLADVIVSKLSAGGATFNGLHLRMEQDASVQTNGGGGEEVRNPRFLAMLRMHADHEEDSDSRHSLLQATEGSVLTIYVASMPSTLITISRKLPLKLVFVMLHLAYTVHSVEHAILLVTDMLLALIPWRWQSTCLRWANTLVRCAVLKLFQCRRSWTRT